MQMRLAYIRPTVRLRRERQEALVAKHEPTLIWYAAEHTADDVAKMMRKAGRVLILPTLDTIAAKREVRNEAIGAVLGSGSTIIEAATDTTLTPDCRDAVMAALRAKQRDLSPADARRAAKQARRGYSVEALEACLPLWTSTRPGREIAAEAGIDYSTLWRYFQRDRAEKVARGRGPGRR